MEQKPVNVRIVRMPTIDRLLALAVVIIAHAGRKIEIWFKGEDGPEPDFEIGFGHYARDFGQKYGSDTERVAALLEDKIPDTTVKTGVAWLIQQANQNNATGHLKEFPLAFGHLCREVWHFLQEDSAEAKVAMRMVADAGVLAAVRYQSWFEGESFERNALDLLRSRPMPHGLIELLKGRAEFMAVRHPLSLAGYLTVSVTNPWPAGIEFEDSLDLRPRFRSSRFTEVGEFHDLFTRCADWRASTERELMDTSGDWKFHWTVEENGRRLCYVKTGLPKAGSVIFDLLDTSELRSDIVVIEAPEGPARQLFGRWSILTRTGARVDLTSLAAELVQIEPGCWHHETRTGRGQAPCLLNGSSARLVPETTGLRPSTITFDELLPLIKRNIGTRRSG